MDIPSRIVLHTRKTIYLYNYTSKSKITVVQNTLHSSEKYETKVKFGNWKICFCNVEFDWGPIEIYLPPEQYFTHIDFSYNS